MTELIGLILGVVFVGISIVTTVNDGLDIGAVVFGVLGLIAIGSCIYLLVQRRKAGSQS